jgi:osmoprotectant transport system permease protein
MPATIDTPAVRVAALAVALVAGLFGAGCAGGEGALEAGFTAEFLDRPDGYPGVKEAYGLEFPSEPKQMDPGLMYRACAEGSVDVISAFATDGRIAAYDLTTLEDDKGFFPPYYAAPLVRVETLERHPGLKDLLNRLGGRLDDATMRRLNLEVDRKDDPQSARQVARDWLVSEGLIDADAEPRTGGGTVVIGGKDFTEQLVLAEIMALMIEHGSDLGVDRKLYLGGTMICFNALRAGDLDLYAEYTGTGLVNILDRPAMSDPDETYRTVKQAFREKYDVVWFEPFGFNNTYTLTMRREQANELGIETISDLAAHLADGQKRN